MDKINCGIPTESKLAGKFQAWLIQDYGIERRREAGDIMRGLRATGFGDISPETLAVFNRYKPHLTPDEVVLLAGYGIQ